MRYKRSLAEMLLFFSSTWLSRCRTSAWRAISSSSSLLDGLKSVSLIIWGNIVCMLDCKHTLLLELSFANTSVLLSSYADDVHLFSQSLLVYENFITYQKLLNAVCLWLPTETYCTCSRIQHISSWTSRVRSRPQFPEVRGAWGNSLTDECLLLPRWPCWKEVLIKINQLFAIRSGSCLSVVLFCLQTHPLFFSLKLPKQEVSSSVLKSCDRKSKLSRTSSTHITSSDDELHIRERPF